MSYLFFVVGIFAVLSCFLVCLNFSHSDQHKCTACGGEDLKKQNFGIAVGGTSLTCNDCGKKKTFYG